MKRNRIISIILIITLLSALTTCVSVIKPEEASTGQIYLYGEQHSVEKILNKEFDLWYDYYHDDNMRHLFVEYGYFTAELLNIWMASDNDDILNAIYDDWTGTSAQNPVVLDFLRKIKSECPETVFHGTDVGHQYDTTGQRYIRYLEDNSMEDSEEYRLAQEAITQGRTFYLKRDDVYRENTMAANFIREFDILNGESVMGFYGGAHTGLNAMDYNTGTVPCMANQLKERYGDNVHSTDLTYLTINDMEPIRVDVITINGIDYEASYFGTQDLTGFKNYAYREYWRLEGAYEDFRDNPTIDVLPYTNYPMVLEAEQVFVIDYTMVSGEVFRKYYRSEGNSWDGKPTTEEFIIE